MGTLEARGLHLNGNFYQQIVTKEWPSENLKYVPGIGLIKILWLKKINIK